MEKVKYKRQLDIKKGDRNMATYVILSTLTDEGRKTLKENPKRILEVNKELEKMGIKVKEQYIATDILHV